MVYSALKLCTTRWTSLTSSAVFFRSTGALLLDVTAGGVVVSILKSRSISDKSTATSWCVPVVQTLRCLATRDAGSLDQASVRSFTRDDDLSTGRWVPGPASTGGSGGGGGAPRPGGGGGGGGNGVGGHAAGQSTSFFTLSPIKEQLDIYYNQSEFNLGYLYFICSVTSVMSGRHGLCRLGTKYFFEILHCTCRNIYWKKMVNCVLLRSSKWLQLF